MRTTTAAQPDGSEGTTMSRISTRARHALRRFTVALVMLAIGTVALAEGGRSPEDTLRAYLKAMKALDFGAVYDLSTKAAAQGKDRETWATEMKYVFQLSEAKIFEYKVFPGKTTENKALVPNILTSQDKFLNQLAAPEYELYTLLREGGEWKVDHQTIVDSDDIPKWFPGEG
jgi:hypothetical protein